MNIAVALLVLAPVTDPEILREIEKQLELKCESDGAFSKACSDLDRYRYAKPLGPGPHTLVIAEGGAFTKIEYQTGKSCQHARDEAKRQIGNLKLQVFCVPR